MIKNHTKPKKDPKSQKEFQEKSKMIKKAFAESKNDDELIKNMEKIGFTYCDDEDA